ncbi:MAG: hypothetical protein KBA40_03075 [Candidatus Peribacteraceae bacterium]|nr:hypothetical protein [Candidatus Peribacteraceae bacterium]
MNDGPHDEGMSLLPSLEPYWKKSPNAPKVRPVSNEKLLRISGEHWIKYVFPSFLFVALSSACFFGLSLAAFTDRYPAEIARPMVLLSCALFWCLFHWFFWFLLAETQTRIIVTSKRVLFIKTGLLWGEETVELAFEKMKSVEAHKLTLLQSILNYGTLQFEPFKIKRVPHPGTMARLIQQSMGML